MATGGQGGGGTYPPCGSNCNAVIDTWEVVNDPPPAPNPCDAYIESLQNDAYFKSIFQYLKTPSITGQDYEFGYLIGSRAQNAYVIKNGNSNENTIDWDLQANTFYDGFLHSHFSGLSAMFSAQDVVFLAQAFLTGHASDTSNLFFGVTSSTGNPYLLKITDPVLFRSFAQKIAGVDGRDKVKIENFENAYKNKFNSNDLIENETEFLKMLTDLGGIGGLGFYESYSNCNTWQKKGLNSTGGLTSINCY